MINVLITGSTGFVGTELIKKLVFRLEKKKFLKNMQGIHTYIMVIGY